MGWVDTHCHLQLDGRSPQELLQRAADVDWLVVPGVDADSSQEALDLSSRFGRRVLATVGLHPHEAHRWGEERVRIESLAPRAVAVGETGLDFYRNLSEPRDQFEAFTGQIELARQLGLPLIVHCRDAFAAIYETLVTTEMGEGAVLHCWTGGPRWTRRFLDLGCWFSFAGPVAFETGDTVRRGAALVPPERALVETDTPYLTPPPYRDQPNEPGFVRLIGEALGRVWGLAADEVARHTSVNAERIFRS